MASHEEAKKPKPKPKKDDKPSRLRTRHSLLGRLHDDKDTRAWEEFSKIYKPFIMGVSQQKGLVERDAEDVVQDVLIALNNQFQKKALQELEAENGTGFYIEQKGKFRSWIYGLTHYKLKEFFRTKKRESSRVDEFYGFSPDDPDANPIEVLADPKDDFVRMEEEMENALKLVVLRKALREMIDERKISARNHQIFESHVVHGRSATEVAKFFGVSKNTVYIVKSRVAEKLKPHVQEILEREIKRFTPPTEGSEGAR